MTKDKDIKRVIPALRFPEFREAEGWEITQLSKLGTPVPGLTYTPIDIRDSGLLVLRSSNIKDGRIVLEDCVYVRENIKGANISQPNDILICVRNGSASLIGKNAIIPYNMPLCTHGAFMTVFRAENPAFVYQLFQTDTYQNQVNADLGARINSINNSQLNKYKFAAPKPNEQQKIADCLKYLDDLISAVADKIEALKEYKKGLMQQLFPADGKTIPALRFPEFQNAGEWKEATLENLSQSIASGKNKNNPDGIYDLYGSTGIIGKTNFGDYDGSYILVARVGANAGLLTKVNGRFGVTDNTLVINLKSGVVFDFIYYLLNNLGLNNLVFGSGQPLITGSQLKGLHIALPLPKEQKKIADCLSSVDELISAETKKLDQLQAHKKGLMQQLFPSIKE